MPERFDPYHAWLGIPANEQPPNHYRLLGLALFESDADVIQNGLDQRLAHVKSFAAGSHAAHSQRLLKEVSQAGVCLLRAEKKQIYDAGLRSALKANAETVGMRSMAPPSPASPKPVAAAAPPTSLPAPEPAVPDPATGPRVAIVNWDNEPASSGFPIVPTIVGSAIGLAVACFVLFMLRGGPSTDTVAQSDPVEAPEVVSDPLNGRSDEVPPASELPARPPKPYPPSGGGEALPPVSPPAPAEPPTAMPNPQPAESPFKRAGTPPPSYPRTLPGSPQLPPMSPESQPGPITGTVPPTPQGPAPSNTPLASPSSPSSTETQEAIVLDLERSVMHIPLAENGATKMVQAQIQSIAKLGTAYDLQPANGTIGIGKPVDIVLTQYAGVKIHVSMHTKGKNVELKVTPEIETGPGKTSDFSKRTLDSAGRSLQKDTVAVNKQLVAAQTEALAIQNWLVSPVPKAITVRSARTQRLNLLTTQTIPALQNQMAYVQRRADVLQQLSLLVKQIHKKASLNLAVRVGPAEKTP